MYLKFFKQTLNFHKIDNLLTRILYFYSILIPYNNIFLFLFLSLFIHFPLLSTSPFFFFMFIIFLCFHRPLPFPLSLLIFFHSFLSSSLYLFIMLNHFFLWYPPSPPVIASQPSFFLYQFHLIHSFLLPSVNKYDLKKKFTFLFYSISDI